MNPEDLPMRVYTKTQLIEVWELYMNHLIQQGKRVQATNLTDYHIQDNIICINVLNETIRGELFLSREEILSFVRQKLQNYAIDIQVRVKVQEKQSQTFTLQDKYQRLLEKNPLLEEFRRTFDLDF